MKKALRSIFDIRKGEVAITLLMVANYYLILATYYFLKPARDSLFVKRVSAEELPYVFILIALAIVPITTLYSRAARSLKLNQTIYLSTAVIIANLAILRWLLTMPDAWVYYVFYVWVSIYGVLTTSQFWLLANAVYDAAQAKRLFVLLGLAGIIGAISGGALTNIATERLHVATSDLLYICMGLLAVTVFLVMFIWRLHDPKEPVKMGQLRGAAEEKRSSFESFKLIKRSRHLMLIVGVIGLTVMIAALVDLQFKGVASKAIADEDELTGFFGDFYSGLSIVSLLLQAFLAHRFLRLLGVGGVILFLPIALMIGSVGILAVPSAYLLYAAVFLRGADGSLRYSLDKTGRELLFLPVPLAVKHKTKLFVDMFVDRWFRGLAAVLVLLLMQVFGFSLRQISFVAIVLIALWILTAIVMRKEYVNAFRLAIERREIDLSEIRHSITESSTLATLRESLKSPNEREVAYALEMLQSATDTDIRPAVEPLLSHSSADIRQKALHLLHDQSDETLVARCRELMTDDDPAVRREAVFHIFSHGEGSKPEKAQTFLDHPDSRVRHAFIACVAAYGDADDKCCIKDTVIEEVLGDREEMGVSGRVQLAEALSQLNHARAGQYLERLLGDPAPAVAKAAMSSIGRLHEREFVPDLLRRLAQSEYRHAARTALAEYGTGVLGTLRDYLLDDHVDSAIRRNIPGVLSRVPDQQAVDVLVEAIVSADVALKYYILKALNKLRAAHPELVFDIERVDQALIDETRTYYEILQVIKVHGGDNNTASKRLLVRALKERQDNNLERIFRLLGLRYPPKDMYSAYVGLQSDQRTVRASAIEFLDNVLHSDIKRYLLPIIDEASMEALVRRGGRFFHLDMNSCADVLDHLVQGRDPWLRACAVYRAGDELSGDGSSDTLRGRIEKARDDPDPIVRETAELVLRRVSGQ